MVNAKVKPAGDLYAVLGVARDADERAIRRGYRRAAKHCHPDAEGGSHEAFQRLIEAHAVLTDEKRRADYDHTGECHAPAPDNTEVLALGIIARMLMELCGGNHDLFTIDLRAKMLNALRGACALLPEEQREISRKRKRAEKLQKHFIRRNGGESQIAALLRSSVEHWATLEEEVGEELAHHQRAIAILGEYDFIVEAPQPGAAKPGGLTPAQQELLAMLKSGLGGFSHYGTPDS